MYGPILSVLLMGMIPVWGVAGGDPAMLEQVTVAPPLPQIAADRPFSSLKRRLSASGVLIVDLESGQTLYAEQAEVRRPMASLTKLMTALLIVENHALDELVTTPKDVEKVIGNRAKLPAGETFTVGDLLSALLVMSGNDAAVTLATYHSGSVPDFVRAMNARAATLGLRDTTYANPTGMDAQIQKSTPRDLAWLTMYVLRHASIAERLSTKTASVTSREGTTLTLTHTHSLLHSSPLITAGKTGTTDGAGQCLLSVVEQDGRRYGVVLLQSSDRYADMRRTLDMFRE